MIPLFATDRTAAKLLDMKPKQFRDLVAAGILPPPINIGKHERWDMEALTRALRGDLETMDGVKW